MGAVKTVDRLVGRCVRRKGAGSVVRVRGVVGKGLWRRQSGGEVGIREGDVDWALVVLVIFHDDFLQHGFGDADAERHGRIGGTWFF